MVKDMCACPRSLPQLEQNYQADEIWSGSIP